jgi:hypothetical protein
MIAKWKLSYNSTGDVNINNEYGELNCHPAIVHDTETCTIAAVSLQCENRSSESIKTSLLKANGYLCDALDGTSVTLV